MKGIHPEFLMGMKGGDIEHLINDVNIQCNIKGSDLQTILKKYNVHTDIDIRDRLMYETEQFRYSESKRFVSDTSAMSIKIKCLHRFTETFNKSNVPCIYRPSKAFFNAVASLNREIPMRYLGSDSEVRFIKIPDLYVQGQKFVGAYTYVTGEMLLVIMLVPDAPYTIMGSRVVMIADHTGMLNLPKTLDRIPVVAEANQNDIPQRPEDATTVVWSDMLFSSRHDKNGETQRNEVDAFNKTVIGIVNTSIYINSQDPVIEELQPLKKYDKKALGQLSSDKKENLCTLPVRLVNWQYHTGRTYNVDETFVGAHLRWQPCGPERKEVKLVWVKEHKRTYGKDTFPGESEGISAMAGDTYQSENLSGDSLQVQV